MRKLAVALMVAGALVAGGGLVGLGTVNDNKPPPTASPTGAARPTSSASPSPSPSPSAAAETVEQFLPGFQSAINSGDAAFLLARLHPAVLDLYGEAQCRTYLSGFKDATLRYTVLSVTGPETYVYNPDGRSIPVENAFKARVRRTSQGATARTDVHVALVDGQLRWFTDCGTPK